MKIGFNVRKIKELIMNTIGFYDEITVQPDISQLNQRVFALETDTSNNWIEITADNGQEVEITEEFSEIRMLASCNTDINYSVTYNFDYSIFHNTIGGGAKYFVCGNPKENNFGCTFKYNVTSEGKQYVSVDNCFSGGSQATYSFRVWIKPNSNLV